MRRFLFVGFGALIVAIATLAQQAGAPATHTLKPTPKSIAWGYYDASTPPVLRVKSGDTVEIQTLITSSPKRLEEAGVPADQVEQSLRDITKEVTNKGPGGHILTGPIYIDSAEPGDMLEVRVLKVTPRVAYGVNNAGQGGAAPDMIKGRGSKVIKYDIAKMTVDFAPDIHFPMRPFMGIMAVAPTKAISSKAPGLYGGNMDFEKLQAGSTLYLPVLVKGALFVTGDSHAGQGDGEVDVFGDEAKRTFVAADSDRRDPAGLRSVIDPGARHRELSRNIRGLEKAVVQLGG